MRQVLAVVAVGTLLGAAVVVTCISNQSTHCCGSSPYASIFRQEQPLSRLDTMLAKGDGQAFAALAEDPLLRRPHVLATPEVFAYRAQRPLWGYLTWAGSAGQSQWVGLVLVVLTILSCGGACAVGAVLLLERNVNRWWSVLIPVIGLETLGELTPELLAVALVGVGILLWERQREAGAVVALSAAALTRETMLVAVAAIGLWHVYQCRERLVARIRRIAPLTIPFCCYAAWIAFVRVRVGAWPWQASQGRFSFPLAGLAQALFNGSALPSVAPWVVLGLVISIGSVLLVRRDVLTWVALAFVCLAVFLGVDVWALKLGFLRTLVPMFVFGAIALASGLQALGKRRARAVDTEAPVPV